MNIGILIWDGVEPLDFCGPYEVITEFISQIKKLGPLLTF